MCHVILTAPTWGRVNHEEAGQLVYIIIPAKAFARDYVITGVGLSVCPAVCLSVCLFVCLFVTTITKLKRGRMWTEFFGKVPGGKASPSSFAVTNASRVWRLLSKNAVNRVFFQCKQTNLTNK